MSSLTANDLKTKGIASGRYIKESAADHVKRVKKSVK